MIRALVLLLTLALPTAALAAPSVTGVSGTIAHGQALSIVGADFGVKAAAAPIRFDDFETGTTVGHLIADDLTWWSRNAGTGQVAEITDAECISGKCGKFTVSTSPANVATRSDSIYRDAIGFNDTGKMLVSTWKYLDLVGDVDGTEGATSWQIKWLDAHRASMIETVVTPEVEMSHWAYNSPPGAGWYNRSFLAVYGNSLTPKAAPNDTFKTAGWYHVTVELYFGTVGVADGTFRMYVSTPSQASPYVVVTDSAQEYVPTDPEAGDPTYPNGLRLGWYHGSWYPTDKTAETGDSYTSTLYYDDIYIDNTFARVEIGNAATYANCTTRALQVPSAWAADAITATANLDGFVEGDPKYLYVLDADGTPNAAGYELTNATAAMALGAGGSATLGAGGTVTLQ